ncbi:MAG TPA: DUF6265 family protein [Candidatus Krumholzibacteria bacterium]|nr:DUF6265 family protein [Candidatus Krumholzibacteria bacterium]
MLRRLTLLTLLVLAAAPAAAQDRCDVLAPLAWLQGEWRTEDGRARETWSVLSKDSWEGVARVGRTEESLRLLAMEGEVFYLAKVAHNDLPTVFRMVECGEHRAAFANPEHDFPQLLVYQLHEDGRLTVDVSGDEGRGFRLDFRKAGPDESRAR